MNPFATAFVCISILFAVCVMTVGCDQAKKTAVSEETSSKQPNATTSLEIVRPLTDASLADTVRNWEKQSYEPENRSGKTGKRSDFWVYKSNKTPILVSVSLDQSFEGWHDLAWAYRKQLGWKMTDFQWMEHSFLIGSNKKWPYAKAEFSNGGGHVGYLLFSFFDDNGNPIDPPSTFDFPGELMDKPWKNLSSDIKKKLAKTKACQTQVFVKGIGDLPDEIKNEMTEHYLVLRNEMRKAYLKSEPLPASQLLANDKVNINDQP